MVVTAGILTGLFAGYTFDVAAGTYTAPVGNACDLEFRSDGTIYVGGPSIEVQQGSWITPNGGADSTYDVRATLAAGSLDSGTTGTWLDLGTTRVWNVGVNGGATLTMEIRDDSAAVVASGSVTINGGGSV